MLELNLSDLNWIAVVVSIIAGQIISTIWFVVLFGDPWAREYGVATKQDHAKEIPPQTYAIGLLCTTLLVLGLAILQQALGITTIGSALGLGVFVAITFAAATSLPGHAFLKRTSAFWIAFGSQAAMILGISIILALWQ